MIRKALSYHVCDKSAYSNITINFCLQGCTQELIESFTEVSRSTVVKYSYPERDVSQSFSSTVFNNHVALLSNVPLVVIKILF